MIPAALLLITSFLSFFFVIFCAYSLTYSQNFFIQYLPVYTLCLFSMLLNEDIVDIEKLDGICSFIFVGNKFSGLFLHPSVFFITHSRFA